jgi:hypothetical protein
MLYVDHNKVVSWREGLSVALLTLWSAKLILLTVFNTSVPTSKERLRYTSHVVNAV